MKLITCILIACVFGGVLSYQDNDNFIKFEIYEKEKDKIIPLTNVSLIIGDTIIENATNLEGIVRVNLSEHKNVSNIRFIKENYAYVNIDIQKMKSEEFRLIKVQMRRKASINCQN